RRSKPIRLSQMKRQKRDILIEYRRTIQSLPRNPEVMMKIVFLDRGTIGPSVELSRASCPHEWKEHGASKHEQVVERLKGANIAIPNKTPIREKDLDQLPD